MKLSMYASGSGGLYFVWIESGIAQGRQVTVQEARDFLKTDKNLTGKGWRIVVMSGNPVAIADVKRVDENHVSLNGKVYRYEIHDRFPDGRIVHQCMKVFVNDDENVEFETKNISTVASIYFFVDNEKEIEECEDVGCILRMCQNIGDTGDIINPFIKGMSGIMSQAKFINYVEVTEGLRDDFKRVVLQKIRSQYG